MSALKKLLTVQETYHVGAVEKTIGDAWVAEWSDKPTVGLVRAAAAELAAKDEQLDKIARYLINEGIVKTDDMADNEVFFYVQKAVAALRERAEKLETAAVNLFQACSDLPLPEMDRMEKEINELADALREAQ